MLYRGLRIGSVVGTEGVEFDLLNFFATTFAPTTLTYFIGILVAD